jgi:hypothetical protein
MRKCDKCGSESQTTWYPMLSTWLCHDCLIKKGEADLYQIQGGRQNVQRI